MNLNNLIKKLNEIENKEDFNVEIEYPNPFEMKISITN